MAGHTEHLGTVLNVRHSLDQLHNSLAVAIGISVELYETGSTCQCVSNCSKLSMPINGTLLRAVYWRQMEALTEVPLWWNLCQSEN